MNDLLLKTIPLIALCLAACDAFGNRPQKAAPPTIEVSDEATEPDFAANSAGGPGQTANSALAQPADPELATDPAATPGDCSSCRRGDCQHDCTAPKRLPSGAAVGKKYGSFEFTYYWIAREIRRAVGKTVKLYTKECKPLAKVGKRFARRLAMEGTGILADGRALNVAGHCDCDYSPCFFALSQAQKWGVGVMSRNLSPFRSVAVDPSVIPIGTKLYVAELDGLTMPGRPPWGGFVHDGCVVADDRGGGIRGKQLDFFAARRRHYKAFARRHKLEQVTVYSGDTRCEDSPGEPPDPGNKNAI